MQHLPRGSFDRGTFCVMLQLYILQLGSFCLCLAMPCHAAALDSLRASLFSEGGKQGEGVLEREWQWVYMDMGREEKGVSLHDHF